MVYSAVVNCVTVVPLMIVVPAICISKTIVGERINGIWSYLSGWTGVILMGLAPSFFLWAEFSGRAS